MGEILPQCHGPARASVEPSAAGSLSTTIRQNLVFLARFHLDVDVRKGDREMRGDGGDT